MCPSSDERDGILQAREMGGSPFRLPWRSFVEFFDERVHDAHHADKPFLTYCDDDRRLRRSYTYAEFGDGVGRLATFMRDRLDLRRGDRVATVLFNHDQTVFVYFAAWVLGLGVVPINVEESTEKKRYILEHSEPSVVFCWQDSMEEMKAVSAQLPRVRELIAVGDGSLAPVHAKPSIPAGEGSLEDEALIVYTSGTTGPPKGVVLTARNLLIDADGIADWHGFGSGDRLMCVLPIHHVNGTVVTLVTPFYFAGGTVLNRKFKSTAFWQRIHDEGDRKSTRLNSSHLVISYAVFCLKKKKKIHRESQRICSC